MRTTIFIPDQLYLDAKTLLGRRSFSEFASEAIERLIEQLKREFLAQEMAEGYRAEAEKPSLDAEWAAFETEGL
jgi:predicted CopG family antitoxin